MNLKNRVVLVTGASSGIGRATALRLAALDATIVAGYHSNEAAARELVAGLPGKEHCALRVSIGEPDSIGAARDAVAERFGRLDILVNCGGFTQPVPAADLDGLTDEIFDDVVRVNLRGPFAMIRAFRPLMQACDNAVVVNVSSIAARTGVGSSLAYCAAKAGLDSLTIGLAKVLAPKIRVFSVSPAGVDTDFVKGRSREKLQAIASATPLQHLTSADDVAKAIIACITHLTSSTGIVVPVDEGRHL